MSIHINKELAEQIIESLKTICDHDINFIDEKGKICASTDPSREGDYHEGGFRAAQTGEIVRIPEDRPESGMRKGINMPIRHHGETIAVIGITGEPGEVERYAALVRRITLLLLREHDIDIRDRAAGRQTDYLVRAMIFHEQTDKEYRDYVLALHGILSHEGRWRTVVFNTGRAGDAAGRRFAQEILEAEDSVGEALRALAEQMQECLFTYLPPYLYVMIAREETIRRHEPKFRKLTEDFPEKLTIGIGSGETFSRQDRSYQNARLAAESAGKGAGPVWIEDLDFEVLLHMVPETAADYYVQKTIGGLREEDLKLLRTYYSCNMSLQETADSLFLHKNTLQYRLNRIRKAAGKDPRNFRDAAALYTALCLGMPKRQQPDEEI